MRDHDINPSFLSPKSLKQQIGFCKRKALEPQDIINHPKFNFTNDFPRFYKDYEEALIEASAFDFEGLLFEVYKLFQIIQKFYLAIKKSLNLFLSMNTKIQTIFNI